MTISRHCAVHRFSVRRSGLPFLQGAALCIFRPLEHSPRELGTAGAPDAAEIGPLPKPQASWDITVAALIRLSRLRVRENIDGRGVKWSMPIRMKDIADDLGLSSITVSKVLRNHPDISEETRQRVLKRVAELDYRPNEIARGLATVRSYLVGLIVPGLLHSFFAEVAMGLSSALGSKGYSVIVASSEEKSEVEHEEIRRLLARRLDALVIASSGLDTELFERMDAQSQPYVLIDRRFPDLVSNFVGTDDVKAGLLATQHLAQIGRHRIAHIAGRANSTGKGRCEGYRLALKQAGLAYREEYVVWGAFVDTHSTEQGFAAMKSLLELRSPPDAVFCHNDPLAIGAMNAILDAGLKIPGDIALIGCGNLHFANSLRVPLSSIDQHSSELGERTGELILDIIHSKAKKPARTVILEPDLVVRASTEI